MTAPTFTKTGTKATTPAKLDKQVFEIMPEDHNLLKDAYVAYLANGRQNLAITKTRGDVRGGGRKPWRQKGTGRARFGSTRNPIWRGGGVAFGPTGIENYSHQLNTKSKRLALRQALSLAAHDNKIKVIETFECAAGKVSQTSQLLKKIEAKGRILMVVSRKDSLVERATRNISDLKAVNANYLNVFDLLNADAVVFSQEALVMVSEWLGDSQVIKVPKEEVSHE